MKKNSSTWMMLLEMMYSKASIVVFDGRMFFVSFSVSLFFSDWHSSAGLTTNPGLHKVLRQRWHMLPEK